MKSVVTELDKECARKDSTTDAGYLRLSKEIRIYEHLKTSPHVAKVLSSKDDGIVASLQIETIKGVSLRQAIDTQATGSVAALPWPEANKLLRFYVAAEMDLLQRGALYRDLNFEHLLFNENGVFFIDLEATLLKNTENEWLLSDTRGTWETMAPEEFSGYGVLTARTATYRVAVIAHLLLAGTLPFEIDGGSRAKTHQWRKNHVPKVSRGFDKKVRKVFMSALSRQTARRHKTPARFLQNLEGAFALKLSQVTSEYDQALPRF